MARRRRSTAASSWSRCRRPPRAPTAHIRYKATAMSEDRSSVALVTGANRGIGREVARQLAAKGFEVIASARDDGKARQAAQELAAADGAAVSPLTLDVASAESIASAAEQLYRRPGRLDVL